MRCTEQRKMPDFVVSPKSWFALLLFLHGYALCQALTEEPNSVIKILKYLLQTILSNGQTNADVDDPLQSGTTQANNSGEDFAQSNSSYCDTECRVHRLQGLDIKVNKESPSVWVHDLSNVKHGNWNVIFPEILEDSLQQNIENISVNTSKPSLLSLGCRGPPCAQCIVSNCDSPALSVPDCNPYLLYGLSLPLDSPHITIYWRPEAAYGLTLTLDKNREDVKVPENDRNRTHRIDIKTREKYVQVDIPSLHRGIILEREEVENAFIKIESWGQSSRWILRCNIATTETTTLIANTNQGSTNISSGNLQEDFGLSQNNTKATAKKMISDLKEVSLLPSDIQRAVDALTALEKEFEKELNLTENGRALELAKEYTADVIEVSGKVLEKPSPWQELAEADRGRASGKVQATVASAAVKVAELLSNRTEDFETENIHILVSSRPANVTTRRYDHVHYPNTYIELPELFYRGYVGEDNNVRVVFISYTTLHSVTNTIPLDPKQASPDVFPAKGQVNSGIINAIVGQKGLWRAGEGEATAVKFGHVYNGEEFLLANASCVWWDEAANAWNTSGCTLNYTDAHVTICRCNHLTSLALLMDVRGFLAKERVREVS
ncbi:uncharacterized protein LOC125040730 [Penaeus chinensis]|uniref:uncharacterized protein LOC125040730 n=1 Tax=Penaeus chinensis TaxID=139456 RepID=UPI001FB61791|nr:uncharacterized protein LOC125040730 [Penaeus chinensis]